VDDLPRFDELVETLLERLYDADALNLSECHSFRKLMSDQADKIADGWYWRAFDDLQADGFLDDGTSTRLNGGDACGRLSAYGARYVLEGRGN
jgi:hypothetical protein